jgi:hypothetical protein
MPIKTKAKPKRSAAWKSSVAAKPRVAMTVGGRSKSSKVRLLAGGNPQMAKADGAAPVQKYIHAIPAWKRDVARKLDAIIVRAAPGVSKAVKWNSPFYGMPGKGWFASFHVFTHYVKLTFFKGTSLTPSPAGGNAKEARWVDVHENDLNEAQIVAWVKQAAKIPGWSGGRE